jgi:hypothetical protein
MRFLATLLLICVMACSFVALVGCTHQQIDKAQAANAYIIKATTQPTAQYFANAPVIGDYVKYALGIGSKVLMLINPLLDFLRPPTDAIQPRETL